jgi:hypothetical protein
MDTKKLRLDENTRFGTVEVGGKTHVGGFRLGRAVGDLAYASALFVVEDDGARRCWPLTAVTCLVAAS